MALHKLVFDDFYDDAFILIAVHCRLENYRLAYLLNQKLNIRLKRKHKDLDVRFNRTAYALYEWKNNNTLVDWHLIENSYKKELKNSYKENMLFHQDDIYYKTYHLISEHKTVDYFIKISDDNARVNKTVVLDILKSIPQIITCYTVDASKLKSKEHLIF